MIALKPKILCVDDEPENLKLLEAFLEPRGYEVLKAGDGGEALKRLDESVDLVLLDVMMPVLNGFEVCRKIRENERYTNVPVVMITALRSKEDRIRAIEAGAEDFISKPFDQGEVLARIRMLLKMKDLNDRLNASRIKIASLINFGEEIIMSFNPLEFDLVSKIDGVIDQIIKKNPEMTDKPQIIIVGISEESDNWQWYSYQYLYAELNRALLKFGMQDSLHLSERGQSGIFFHNENDLEKSELQAFIDKLKPMNIAVSNIVCFLSDVLCVFALNYGRVVSRHDAEVLNSMVAQSLFLKSLAEQVKNTESAFEYTVSALARAAEVHDEDTGDHIVRVGEYAAVLAGKLDMPENFIKTIRLQAQMHDVGKIHTPADILKKPAKLTPEEWEETKRHTIYGARILGDHKRLSMAKTIALSHHERWDGSGYPYGLKGQQIPVEGRILNLADQYDALRNPRVYKPALDHQTTHGIITEGDGRTLPQHFDPRVLEAFKGAHKLFDEIYESFKG